MRLLFSVIICFFLAPFWGDGGLFAQGEIKYITFSGVVLDAKTKEPLPGAYVTIPQAGRGTLTNARGYFIINVFPGDTLVFSFIGFKKQYHIIPRKTELDYSVIVEMREDAKMLKEVKVYPFSTEEEFKQALVDMQLPDEKERRILEQTFSKENVAIMAAFHGMSADANFRYAMNQQNNALQNRGMVTTNPLLNPFSWINFIRSAKNGDLKKDDSWKAAAKQQPKETVTRDELYRRGKGN
ncbi:MAG: carboxypeptidase-like regulatory domain-containing protein [Spirosomataceae bacterium]